MDWREIWYLILFLLDEYMAICHDSSILLFYIMAIDNIFSWEHDWRIFLPEYSREILKTSNRWGLEIFCKISSDGWFQGFWKTLGMNFDSPLWCSQSSSIFYWRNAPEYFINIWKSSYYSSCFPLNRMAIEILFFKSLELDKSSDLIWFLQIWDFIQMDPDPQSVGRCRKSSCYLMKKCNWLWEDLSPESFSMMLMNAGMMMEILMI